MREHVLLHFDSGSIVEHVSRIPVKKAGGTPTSLFSCTFTQQMTSTSTTSLASPSTLPTADATVGEYATTCLGYPTCMVCVDEREGVYALGHGNGWISIVNAHTEWHVLALFQVFPDESAVSCLCTLSKSWVSIGSASGMVSLWKCRRQNGHLVDWEEVRAKRIHERKVMDVQFHPGELDGPIIVSASLDRTIRLWYPFEEEGASNPVIFWGHNAGVTCVAFHPSGRFFASGDQEGCHQSVGNWEYWRSSMERCA